MMDGIDDQTEAVARLVHDEYVRLARAVALACGSMPVAEDAVQEALARAWERAQRGETFERLGAWVVTVALNLARSGHRHQVRHERAVVELGHRLQPASAPEGATDLDLQAAVGRLPRRQREAVVLHYYLGFDVASVATTLGVSPGTVKTALFRARAALAAALGDPEVSRRD